MFGLLELSLLLPTERPDGQLDGVGPGYYNEAHGKACYLQGKDRTAGDKILPMHSFALNFAGVALVIALLGCGGSKPAKSGAGGATSVNGTGGTTSAGGGSGGGGLSGGGGTLGTGGTTSAGGGGGRGGGGGATVPPDAGPVLGTGGSADFGNRYVNAFCQFFAKCGVSPSVAACKADYFDSGAVDLTALVQDIDSGKIIYDASYAPTCFDAIAATACTEPATAQGAQTNSLCTSVIRGTVAAGGNCVTDAECVGGVCHQPSCGASCCLGTCGQPLATGAACTSSTECAAGNYCSSQGTCQPQGAQGQSCTYNSQCQSGLSCDNNSGSGTCAPYVKDGQACTPDGADCENINGFCDPTTGKCRARLAVGAACSVPDGGISRLNAGCAFYADCREGICVALPGPGEACSVPDSGYAALACMVGTCTNGVCQQTVNPPCTVASATAPDAGARD
jgi:hypothetical protein